MRNDDPDSLSAFYSFKTFSFSFVFFFFVFIILFIYCLLILFLRDLLLLIFFFLPRYHLCLFYSLYFRFINFVTGLVIFLSLYYFCFFFFSKVTSLFVRILKIQSSLFAFFHSKIYNPPPLFLFFSFLIFSASEKIFKCRPFTLSKPLV